MAQVNLEPILALRRRLHDHPELSGRETYTLQVLQSFLTERTTLEVQDRGGWLLAAHREGEGLPSIAFRADFDAIPVEGSPGLARHGCGHDGHAAILCALALRLEGERFGKNIYLIFQCAEETGLGGRLVCESWPEIARLDAVYALHNIPGYPLGEVLTRPGCFACASCGLVVRIQGRPAHAAYPGEGANPIELLAALALETPAMIEDVLQGSGRLLMRTLIGLQAGGDNFGLSASEGRLCLTLRGHRQQDIDALIGRIRRRTLEGCAPRGMRCSFELTDVFPDTTSHASVHDDALKRFAAAGLPLRTLPEPMRWSEDFGWILKRAPGLYFGIGSGERCPGLHTAAYTFDDALIPHALRAFEALL